MWRWRARPWRIGVRTGGLLPAPPRRSAPLPPNPTSSRHWRVRQICSNPNFPYEIPGTNGKACASTLAATSFLNKNCQSWCYSSPLFYAIQKNARCLDSVSHSSDYVEHPVDCAEYAPPPPGFYTRLGPPPLALARWKCGRLCSSYRSFAFGKSTKPSKYTKGKCLCYGTSKACSAGLQMDNYDFCDARGALRPDPLH